MENNWVCIYSTSKLFNAEMAKDILYENGIPAVIINKQDSTYLFGFQEIYVERDHAVIAKHILQKAEFN
jgi:replication initiation and membrane attachment protein DnaB